MTLKCGECGKFAKIVDHYTPFGNSNDFELPDEILLCQKCVDNNMAYHRQTKSMFSHWIPAKYEENLAKELGFMWFNLEGCAWGYWVGKK